MKSSESTVALENIERTFTGMGSERLIFETGEDFGAAPSRREIRMAQLDASGEAVSL